MSKMSKKKIIGLVLIFVFTLAGFTMGQAVKAATGSSGTQSDPLVTKSYIDSRVSNLQEQIDTLEEEIEELKDKVEDLEKE